MTHPTTTSPHPYPRRWRILGFLGVAQLMLILDVTVVAVALPNIAADLGLGRQPLTWVVSGYTLAFGGLLLLGGRAADLFGARRLVVVGLVAFAGASLLAGLAPTGWALLAGRVLQGLAAAFLSPSARIAATSLAGTSPAGFSRAFTTTAVVAAVAALVTIAVAPCRQAPGSPAGVQRDERAAPAGRRRRRPGPGPDLARSSRSIEKGAS